MDFQISNISETDFHTEAVQPEVVELSLANLALVGGGVGEVIFG